MEELGALIARWRDALSDFASPRREISGLLVVIASAMMIVVAILLRVAFSDYSPTYDELASLHFANRPVAGLWSPRAVIETNPPLFYTMLSIWKDLGAQSVVQLRALPIAIGAISIMLAGLVAYRWFGPRAGLIAVVLMSVSAPHIFYSQLLRGYILSLDGVLISIAGLLLVINQRSPREIMVGWALHVGGAVLAIYSHTTMFLWPVIAAVGLIGFFRRQLFARRWHLLMSLAVANIAILLLTSWWLWITVLQLSSGAETIAFMKSISAREYVRQIMATSMLAYDEYDRDKLATNVVALLSLASAMLIWKNKSGKLIVLLAVSAICVFGIAGALKPILMPRTIFWMSIFPVLLIAAGLGTLRSKLMGWGLMTICIALLSVNSIRQVPRFGGGGWTAAIARIARDPEAVVLVQGTGMGSNAQQACLLQLRRNCPFPVIVVPFDPDATSRPSWTGDAIKETPLDRIRQQVAPSNRIYAISNPGAEPIKALEAAAGRPIEPGYKPFMEGPLDPALVLSGI